MYWIASDDTAANHTSSNIRLTPLQNIKDKLKHHMSEQHRLGDAKIETGYYQYWKGLLNSVTLPEDPPPHGRLQPLTDIREEG
jgi:hypothetical protein